MTMRGIIVHNLFHRIMGMSMDMGIHTDHPHHRIRATPMIIHRHHRSQHPQVSYTVESVPSHGRTDRLHNAKGEGHIWIKADSEGETSIMRPEEIMGQEEDMVREVEEDGAEVVEVAEVEAEVVGIGAEEGEVDMDVDDFNDYICRVPLGSDAIIDDISWVDQSCTDSSLYSASCT